MRLASLARHACVALLRWVVIALVALMTIDVLWGVFTRFVLGNQAPYTDEAARFLLVWTSFLGGALAFEAKAHLGVDFLVAKFDPSARKAGAIVVQLLILFFAVAVLVCGGWRMAMAQMGNSLATMPWIPRGVQYLAAPIGGAFVALFALEALADIFRTPADKLGAMTQSEG